MPRVARILLVLPLWLLFLMPPGGARAYTFSVLYTFHGTDGSGPIGRLLVDSAGTIYGTTYGIGLHGGTAYSLTSTGIETTLHSFGSDRDGSSPASGLIVDESGNFYGTASHGGWGRCRIDRHIRCGMVFELAPTGTESQLYNFTSRTGDGPFGRLVKDKAGDLFGATYRGGDKTCLCGVVFEYTGAGIEKTLHTFRGGTDGAEPFGGVIKDKIGNLYGTTFTGGACNCGTIFEIAADGNESILYTFEGGVDGAYPESELVLDNTGNLYGTTVNGGAYGYGTVFRLSTAKLETTLYSFTGGSDGANPMAGLLLDGAGNLYGAASLGGDTSKCNFGCGVVFELTPKGTETVLYTFEGGADGAYPNSPLKMDKAGNLYGTASGAGDNTCNGGGGCGTVFKLAP